MFKPDFTKIDGSSVLAAMGHAFFHIESRYGFVLLPMEHICRNRNQYLKPRLQSFFATL